MLIIPTLTDGTAVYTFQTALDGTTYGMDLLWNDRESAWYLNLYDAAGNPLVMGRKIVIGLPLLGRFQSTSGLPLGDFLVIDTSNTGIPPTLLDFGSRVLLLYFTQADLAGIP